MARSPSPTGSARSSHRTSRRGDERYSRDRRDDGRSHRHRRSRSRSPDRSHRDSHRRRDRSSDRRPDPRDDVHRHARRERSRDRRRSRSPIAARRRSRDYRERRDGSRDRRRPEGSADQKQRSRREDSRERAGSSKADESKHAEAQKLAEEEKKKAERIARLQAWKERQAAERDAKMKEAAASGGVKILQDMDKKAMGSPLNAASPDSPQVDSTPQSPAAYAGKFDPKAIMKRSSAKTAAHTALGIDAPTVATGKSASSSNKAAMTNKSKAGMLPSSLGKSSSRPLKAAGFGLAAKSAVENEKKRGLDFGDEESTRKKLEKLPTPPLDEIGNETAPANDEQDDGDDVDMAEEEDEEEAMAAARAAVEKRAQAEQEAETYGDVAMADVPIQDNTETNDIMEEDEEDEVDPLDAFMAGLDDSKQKSKPKSNLSTAKKGRLQEPEALFEGEDGIAAEDMEPVDSATTEDILAITSKKRKRDIPSVDHNKYQYEPFRKNFYTEPVDMQHITEEEVNNIRFELDGIKVRGIDVPKPVLSWAQCGLGVQTLDVIKSLNYEKPTSIQSQAIPSIMSGRDVIGVAKTGSGKTIAFLMPMFRHIKDQKPLDTLDGPIGLVMTPTRELATQIYRECRPFLKALGLRAVCAYGGAPIKDQIADLKRGAEIIVCTPGRMIELLSANSGRVTNLRRITYIVLDEADRMFDMGFEPQVMKIMGNIRPERQVVLFSATFPKNMEALARKVLNKPVEIVVGGRSVVAPEITQLVEVRAESTKFLRLLELLGELYDKDEDARTLIFVDRQEAADGLLRDLMRKGYPCNSIHGGKDQIDRDSTIDDFKAGVIPIMIATSVAARGLDVKQLKLVVNYDAPNHLEDYVHRAGRTGRAGNTGTAVTFITEEQDKYSVDILKALKQSGAPVPEPVQKLAESFIEKVKSGKAKTSGSGFGGKGLERLDQDRDAARNRERKTYRTGDEPEEEEKDTNKDEDIITKAASLVTSSAAVNAAAAAAAAAADPLARHLDENSIVVHKTEVPVKSAAGGAKSGNALDQVRAAVANIAGRLTQRNQLNPGHPIDNKGPDAGAFHATLEINDFPQKARWAVTNRTNVAKILDSTGTSITTKGNFYAAGAKVGPNDAPKLYILVEGDTENVVTTAMRELMRLLREGTVAAADQDARAPASGRYSVV